MAVGGRDFEPPSCVEQTPTDFSGGHGICALILSAARTLGTLSRTGLHKSGTSSDIACIVHRYSTRLVDCEIVPREPTSCDPGIHSRPLTRTEPPE